MWHKFASLALTVGAFVAAKAIPAGVVLTLGPMGIPVAALVSAACTAVAAIVVNPDKASDILSTVVHKLTGGALGTPPANASPSQSVDSIGSP